MKTVIIYQHRLLHYRVELFERLKIACAERGIDLSLFHGQASFREQLKKDEGFIGWAIQTFNYFFKFGSRDVLWQRSAYKTSSRVDLVVLMQENRILSNYPILLSRIWSKRKVAYWGHGVNFQSSAPSGIREMWKRFLLTKVDWWFAYTSTTSNILKESGFPDSRITCLNNAIDSNGFKKDLTSVSLDKLEALRVELGIQVGAPVGLFCGSLYPEKKLDFLLEAADLVRSSSPDFSLIVIGDGPSRETLVKAAVSRPWMHVVGVKKGVEKAALFLLADFMFNPGLVGLHLVDAFCAGLVLVTTRDAKHSPEISYLEDGVNGFMTDDNVSQYADLIISLCQDRGRLDEVKANSLAASNVYTLDAMVKSFVDGIDQCLRV